MRAPYQQVLKKVFTCDKKIYASQITENAESRKKMWKGVIDA